MKKKKLESAVTDLTHSVGLLLRRVRAAAALASDELSLAESMVIARLFGEGPATAADLARAEGMKPQSMGTAVARLEKMGIVRRRPHPVDGRQMNIELTRKGAALRKSVRQAKLVWLMQAIARLDKKEQETLFAAGGIIKRLAES